MNPVTVQNKRDQLAALVKERMFETEADSHLELLMQRCEAVARIVHADQKDLAGAPYIQHVLRVAQKADTALGYCVAVLHDAIEDGHALGIDYDFLVNEVGLPSIIGNAVEALSRKPGETYHLYLQRVLSQHTAAKVKLSDSIDNADISRYHYPDKEAHMRCGRYLDKAQTLKSSISFQSRMAWDYILDLVQLSQLKIGRASCRERVSRLV